MGKVCPLAHVKVPVLTWPASSSAITNEKVVAQSGQRRHWTRSCFMAANNWLSAQGSLCGRTRRSRSGSNRKLEAVVTENAQTQRKTDLPAVPVKQEAVAENVQGIHYVLYVEDMSPL